MRAALLALLLVSTLAAQDAPKTTPEQDISEVKALLTKQM